MSRIVLGIGITLSVASVLSIYITSLASQNQSAATSSPSSSQVSSQSVASNVSNSTSANTTSTTTAITIPQGASTQQASLNLKYFTPVNASVPEDAAITWTNKDIAPHTATASDGSFDTGMINVGSTGSATVKGQGDIQYHCTIHPWMHGSLSVSN